MGTRKPRREQRTTTTVLRSWGSTPRCDESNALVCPDPVFEQLVGEAGVNSTAGATSRLAGEVLLEPVPGSRSRSFPASSAQRVSLPRNSPPRLGESQD